LVEQKPSSQRRAGDHDENRQRDRGVSDAYRFEDRQAIGFGYDGGSLTAGRRRRADYARATAQPSVEATSLSPIP